MSSSLWKHVRERKYSTSLDHRPESVGKGRIYSVTITMEKLEEFPFWVRTAFCLCSYSSPLADSDLFRESLTLYSKKFPSLRFWGPLISRERVRLAKPDHDMIPLKVFLLQTKQRYRSPHITHARMLAASNSDVYHHSSRLFFLLGDLPK